MLLLRHPRGAHDVGEPLAFVVDRALPIREPRPPRSGLLSLIAGRACLSLRAITRRIPRSRTSSLIPVASIVFRKAANGRAEARSAARRTRFWAFRGLFRAMRSSWRIIQRSSCSGSGLWAMPYNVPLEPPRDRSSLHGYGGGRLLQYGICFGIRIADFFGRSQLDQRVRNSHYTSPRNGAEGRGRGGLSTAHVVGSAAEAPGPAGVTAPRRPAAPTPPSPPERRGETGVRGLSTAPILRSTCRAERAPVKANHRGSGLMRLRVSIARDEHLAAKRRQLASVGRLDRDQHQ